MNLRKNIKRAFHALAWIGGTLSIISGPYYFFETVSYAASSEWHFQHASGWGFRFIATLEVVILGLIISAPFWIFTKNDVSYLPNRRRINACFAIGLLLLLLAGAMESLLQKLLP